MRAREVLRLTATVRGLRLRVSAGLRPASPPRELCVRCAGDHRSPAPKRSTSLDGCCRSVRQTLRRGSSSKPQSTDSPSERPEGSPTGVSLNPPQRIACQLSPEARKLRVQAARPLSGSPPHGPRKGRGGAFVAWLTWTVKRRTLRALASGGSTGPRRRDPARGPDDPPPADRPAGPAHPPRPWPAAARQASSRWSSPFTRETAVILLPVRVNRWIEVKLPPPR